MKDCEGSEKDGSCAITTCPHKVKKYGVCGIHKLQAFQCDDDDFQADLNRYRQIQIDLEQEDTKLEANGINSLNIQACWNGNLAGPRQHPYPPHFQMFGDLLDQSQKHYDMMLGKYDAALVDNCCIRLRHSLEKSTCACKLCSLG